MLPEKLKELETKTGYSKVYFFVAFASLFLGTIALIGGFKLITDLFGFLYPAYQSFKAMESSPKESEATQWLTYWVVFSSLSVVEAVFTFVVNWIPMYYILKTFLVMWLYHPKTMGAAVIYNQVVRPYVLPLMDMNKTTKKTE